MAKTQDMVIKVKADTTEFDAQMARLIWQTFLLTEREWAAKGSGLTQEQMIGARLYHDWAHRQKDS